MAKPQMSDVKLLGKVQHSRENLLEDQRPGEESQRGTRLEWKEHVQLYEVSMHIVAWRGR